MDQNDIPANDKRKGFFTRLEEGLREYYIAPYRREFARAQRDDDDLFMMLIFSESLGIPNPATYYTLELLPVVYDRFHDWHRRMGMERSPLDHVSCC
ncbi:MAG: cory-CC-star protein [Gammaproteobacteria bacterium]|nr:cory-CC-star protein [Gammaproteobacteria bacterium]MDO9317743.1 cory-CC-star protein [Gammaproteobacteria bacterium]